MRSFYKDVEDIRERQKTNPRLAIVSFRRWIHRTMTNDVERELGIACRDAWLYAGNRGGCIWMELELP